MRRFRRFFALLFILSTFIGAMHEVIHHHHHFIDAPSDDDGCPIYQLTQVIAVAAAPFQLPKIIPVYEPYRAMYLPTPAYLSILLRSRSPPLS